MTSINPNSAESFINPIADNRTIETGRTLFIVAGLLSALLPGAGQYLRKRFVAAIVFLLGYVGLWSCFWPFRLPRHPYILLALVWGLIALIASASLHAAFSLDATRRHLHRVWMLVLIPAVIAALFVHLHVMDRASGFRPFGIPSTSMEPTVMKGDHIIVDLRAYANLPPQRGDLVVFRKEGLYIIKRVVATGGDTISGKGEMAFVNGRQLSEPYAVHRMNGSVMDQLVNFGPIVIPSGKLFVMGDNRDVSYDSRMPEYGPVDVTNVVGKPLYAFRRPGGEIAIPVR